MNGWIVGKKRIWIHSGREREPEKQKRERKKRNEAKKN